MDAQVSVIALQLNIVISILDPEWKPYSVYDTIFRKRTCQFTSKEATTNDSIVKCCMEFVDGREIVEWQQIVCVSLIGNQCVGYHFDSLELAYLCNKRNKIIWVIVFNSLDNWCVVANYKNNESFSDATLILHIHTLLQVSRAQDNKTKVLHILLFFVFSLTCIMLHPTKQQV